MKLEGMKNPGKRMKKLEKKDGGSLRITTLSAPQMTDVNPNRCGELDHPKEFLPFILEPSLGSIAEHFCIAKDLNKT
jgi:hypothetical protein